MGSTDADGTSPLSQSETGAPPAQPRSTRRNFLRQSALAAAMVPLAEAVAQTTQPAEAPRAKPNVLMVISDQYRSDFVCGYEHNPTNFTPNLDGMLERGTAFEHAYTNQPLCSPARSCLLTGKYATQTGVWRLGLGLEPEAVTLATLLREQGYSTNYIGKWHLAPNSPGDEASHGYVPPQFRGGFDDLWQASNELERTTHPYQGTIWDGSGKAMTYDGIYRVDYLTNLAVDFLKKKQEKPFFLVLSQLEPHQQNDLNGFAPPKGYDDRFRNPFVPPDLVPFPGDWPFQIANYYGDCKSIDESMGKIFQTLKEQNLDENTIVIFLSDHGCHFRTRNQEYKRSPHDSSLRIPLIIQGPGFDNNRVVGEMVSLVDIAPTLLAALGIEVPAAMSGRNFLPLIDDAAARRAWRNEVFVQISESETARAIRTPEWTYVALAPDAGRGDAGSMEYRDYQLYNNFADPAQIVNLAGRSDPPNLVQYAGNRSMTQITDQLRQRLMARMEEAGEKRPRITRWAFYP